jgi:hypothetical protein
MRPEASSYVIRRLEPVVRIDWPTQIGLSRFGECHEPVQNIGPSCLASRRLDDIRQKLYEPAIDSVSGVGPALPDLSAI